MLKKNANVFKEFISFLKSDNHHAHSKPKHVHGNNSNRFGKARIILGWYLSIFPMEWDFDAGCQFSGKTKRGGMNVIAQKMMFSIKDFPVNVTKSAVSCRFAHIYWRNP